MERMLAIDDDVLAAAEELAGAQKISVSKVISELTRSALVTATRRRFALEEIPTIPMRDATQVTVDFVNKLRERLGE